CAPPARSACEGKCVPPAELYFVGPYLVWLGNGTAPACPVQASGRKYAGVAQPAPPPCPKCACAPSTGSCAEPATITASTLPCSASASGTPFDVPASWDGSCTVPNAAPDAESVTVAPLIVEDSCLPTSDDQIKDVPAPGAALACTGSAPPGQCA